MKGGVTSGIVYPAALRALSEKYRFCNIGGTSLARSRDAPPPRSMRPKQLDQAHSGLAGFAEISIGSARTQPSQPVPGQPPTRP